ncbi:PREDICTED: leucine-rich repeat-containing protein 74A [Thamnophis sirtalis]|uniref:Leucine-rich repeat-containing protein 74A n=1 Tax=Thamnophis sirtalis TaxID=35019 RepID=A0A6I9Y0M4_9SAUR|nr:PREDICTED: leucine-rich repeat-containing protein 74A [Thamnophis sirtalis]
MDFLQFLEEEEEEGSERSESSTYPETLSTADASEVAEEKREDSSDTDLSIEDAERSFTTVKGPDLYREACKLVGVIPVSYFSRNMEESVMNLNHHGLGPKGTKAIAIALVSNTTITQLELEDNWILAEGTTYLVQMLRENCYIQEMNISHNHLNKDGAEAICRMFYHNISNIRSIRLAGRFLPERQKDATERYSALRNTTFALRKISLKNPRILAGRNGTIYRIMIYPTSVPLGPVNHRYTELFNTEGELKSSQELKQEGMEMNWYSYVQIQSRYNEDRKTKGLYNKMTELDKILTGTDEKVNGTLKILSLSWNGFGNDGAFALGEALKVNITLAELDISNNHISNDGAIKLSKGLEMNGSLRILKMSQNLLTVEGAIALLMSVRKNPKSRMEEINISNVLVNEGFIRLLDHVCEVRPELDIIYGGIGGHVVRKTEHQIDAMKLIQVYLDINKLKPWDFFKSMDKYGDMKIPVAEFRRAMMLQSKIPLKRLQVVDLVRKLDPNRTGYVDYSHYRVEEPVKKPKKNGDEEEEEEDDEAEK